MAYSVVTPAASEPITLTEAKNFLRVDGSDDDVLIGALISAAREMCEQYTRRILVTTTIDEYFDGFPNYKNAVSKDIIYLSRGPVQSITNLKYVDEIGSEETVASSYYVSDTISEPARIASTAGWFATNGIINQVIVRYVVGTAVDSIPTPLKQGMLLIISDLYDKRDDRVRKMPTASEYLFNPFRIFTF